MPRLSIFELPCSEVSACIPPVSLRSNDRKREARYAAKSFAPVYVEDVARAFIEAMLQKQSGARTVNLTGHATTVETAVGIIRSVAGGADISISGEPIPSLSTATNERDTCGLKLPAEHSLAEGLEKTIAFSRV